MSYIERMLDLDALRRWPDVESPSLQAHDATDRYLLDLAGERGLLTGTVAVIGDRHGALTLGALAAGAERVRVHQDALTGQRALDANAGRVGVDAGRFEHLPLDPALTRGASCILLQLPRSLDALDEIASSAALGAPADARLLAGGRLKHMSRSMNDVLARSFGRVDICHARQKSRILVASEPRADAVLDWPCSRRHAVPGIGIDVELIARGAVFGGAALDPGATRLLQHIGRMREAHTAIDLGCGNGILSAAFALSRPGSRILATDVSHAAVDSARRTAAANGLESSIDVRRADGLEGIPDGTAELILLNPPFHIGAAVHTGIAERLIADAGRALARGGELWCVWNAHLGYRPLLERIGATEQVSRDRTFVVTVTRR